MDGVSGYSGWRWIFLLEGLLTIVLAVVAHFLLPDFPEDCAWLSDEQKVYLKERTAGEDYDFTTEGGSGARRQTLREGLKSHFSALKSYLGALMYFGEFPDPSFNVFCFACKPIPPPFPLRRVNKTLTERKRNLNPSLLPLLLPPHNPLGVPLHPGQHAAAQRGSLRLRLRLHHLTVFRVRTLQPPPAIRRLRRSPRPLWHRDPLRNPRLRNNAIRRHLPRRHGDFCSHADRDMLGREQFEGTCGAGGGQRVDG